MATVDFEVAAYGKNRGSAAATLTGALRLSGQDTITTAENIEDASGDITVTKGEVVGIYSTAALRIAFGGTAATGTTGHYIPATTFRQIEASASGTVSAIEAS